MVFVCVCRPYAQAARNSPKNLQVLRSVETNQWPHRDSNPRPSGFLAYYFLLCSRLGGLDAVEKIKFSCQNPESNPDFWRFVPYLSHYTDWINNINNKVFLWLWGMSECWYWNAEKNVWSKAMKLSDIHLLSRLQYITSKRWLLSRRVTSSDINTR
jgi:hypothetical protein